MENTLKIRVLPGGALKLDARGVYGSEDDILTRLRSLARTVGGDESALTVEGHHHDHVGQHHHGEGHWHHHA